MLSPRLTAKSESEEPTLRLAVLIDADNAQAAVIDGLLAEIARFGEATVKRIYGDFTAPTSASWKKVLQRYAIKPVQQFAYTTGKNATDSTLIIDAMDLLYTYWRRPKIDPPCRSKFDPGRGAAFLSSSCG